MLQSGMCEICSVHAAAVEDALLAADRGGFWSGSRKEVGARQQAVGASLRYLATMACADLPRASVVASASSSLTTPAQEAPRNGWGSKPAARALQDGPAAWREMIAALAATLAASSAGTWRQCRRPVASCGSSSVGIFRRARACAAARKSVERWRCQSRLPCAWNSARHRTAATCGLRAAGGMHSTMLEIFGASSAHRPRSRSARPLDALVVDATIDGARFAAAGNSCASHACPAPCLDLVAVALVALARRRCARRIRPLRRDVLAQRAALHHVEQLRAAARCRNAGASVLIEHARQRHLVKRSRTLSPAAGRYAGLFGCWCRSSAAPSSPAALQQQAVQRPGRAASAAAPKRPDQAVGVHRRHHHHWQWRRRASATAPPTAAGSAASWSGRRAMSGTGPEG